MNLYETAPFRGGFFITFVLLINRIMKKIVLLVMMTAGLVSCNTPSDVPQLDLPLSKALKDNKELKEFVSETIESVNTLARECVKMHAQAEEFINVDFDSLTSAQQQELVRKDYEYVELWYNFNVLYTARTIKLLEYLKDSSMPKEQIADLGKIFVEINKFVQNLKETYGEDLKLDPYPTPVE